MTGPNRQHLEQGLATAKPGRVHGALTDWVDTGTKIGTVALALHKAAQAGDLLGGQTGKAMFEAMMASSERLVFHVDQMKKGVGALQDAQDALEKALAARDKIDADLPPYEQTKYVANPDLSDDENTNAKSLHDNAETTAFADREARREERAAKVAEHFETRFAHPIKVMQEIYGYTAPPAAPTPTPDNGIGTPTRGGYQPPTHQVVTITEPPVVYPIEEPPTCTFVPPEQPTVETPTTPTPTTTTNPPPTSTPPFSPVPPTATPPYVPGGDLPGGGSGGSGGGSGGGIPGGLVGGAAGAAGLAGLAGLVRSGVIGRGSSTLPGGTAPLGGTARGASGTLGRAGAAAGAGGAGARGGAGAGGTGTRGGRGGGAGAGAGGRGRGKKDRKDGSERDLFDEGDDWLDDDGGTGVLS